MSRSWRDREEGLALKDARRSRLIEGRRDGDFSLQWGQREGTGLKQEAKDYGRCQGYSRCSDGNGGHHSVGVGVGGHVHSFTGCRDRAVRSCALKGQVWRGLSLSAGEPGGAGGEEASRRGRPWAGSPGEIWAHGGVGWPVLALRRLGAGSVGARSGRLGGGEAWRTRLSRS